MDTPITNTNRTNSPDLPNPGHIVAADQPQAAPLNTFCTVDITAPVNRDAHVLEQNINAMIKEMLKLLALDIDSSRLPAIVIDDSQISSHFNPKENKLSFKTRDANDGFAWGEEIMHWIRHVLTEGHTKIAPEFFKLSLLEEKAVSEFFGYVGRQIAFQAASNRELEKFFSSDSIHRPQNVAALKLAYQIQMEAKKSILDLSQSAASLPNDQLAENCSEALYDITFELQKDDWQANLTLIMRNLNEVVENMQKAIKIIPKNDLELHDNFIKIYIETAGTLGKICKVLEAIKNTVQDSTRSFERERNQIVKTLAAIANNLGEYSLLRMELDYSYFEKQVNVSLTENSYDHHLAGYASAVVFMQKQNNLVAAVQDLLPLDSSIINAKQILFNTDLQLKSRITKLLDYGRALLSRWL